MALQLAEPPKVARNAVRKMLAHPATPSAFRAAATQRAPAHELAMSTPHRVAVLPLRRIGPETTLRADAQMRGWRFLVHHGNRVVATADTVVDRRGQHAFGHLNQGPFVRGTEQAIRHAEACPAARRQDFEPILLMVPTLYVMALWLRDSAGDRDRVVIIPHAPGARASYRVLTERAFVARLVRLAAQRRTARRRPRAARRR